MTEDHPANNAPSSPGGPAGGIAGGTPDDSPPKSSRGRSLARISLALAVLTGAAYLLQFAALLWGRPGETIVIEGLGSILLWAIVGFAPALCLISLPAGLATGVLALCRSRHSEARIRKLAIAGLAANTGIVILFLLVLLVKH